MELKKARKQLREAEEDAFSEFMTECEAAYAESDQQHVKGSWLTEYLRFWKEK